MERIIFKFGLETIYCYKPGNMTQRTQLIQQIISKMDSIPENKLRKILDFLDDNSTLNEQKKTILSFAGKWKDLDAEVFRDLTENLHLRRSNNERAIN